MRKGLTLEEKISRAKELGVSLQGLGSSSGYMNEPELDRRILEFERAASEERSGGGSSLADEPRLSPNSPLTISPTKLRTDVSPTGRALLDEMWGYHRDNGFGYDAWPTKQAIHIRHGKEEIGREVAQLPAGSIYVTGNPLHRYALSFLGLLLTSGGTDFERVLIHYLEFVVEKAREEPHVSRIDGSEATRAVNLGPNRRALVGRLVNIAGLWSHDFTPGETWSCGVPEGLDDLVETTNLTSYLWQRALDDAHRAVHTSVRVTKAQSERSALWFVRSRSLRDSLERDFEELKVAARNSAAKSTVVLSGEILEGILLDELRCRSRAAIREYRRLRGSAPRPLVRWTLGDLIDVASSLSLLPGGTVQLSNAVREFRDLVHPGRSARMKLQVSAEEAKAAHAALEVCRKHFAERAARRKPKNS